MAAAKKTGPSPPPRSPGAPSKRWRDVDPEKPAFLWVHYFDPHFPYRPPPGFPDQPLARECRDLTQKTLVQPRIQWSLHANWGGLAEAALSDCLELYDAEIHYTDTEIAQLLYGLGNLDFLDSVIVAITADHGERLRRIRHLL